MTQRYLIVNADDFGWTEGINAGIIETYKNGLTTSATLLATGAARDDAVRQARAEPSLGVGVHLSYELGRPLIAGERLWAIFRRDGTARYGTLGLWAGVGCRKAARRQLREHFRSQIEWVIEQGVAPTHVDTHKHVHYNPIIMRMVCVLAGEYGIPAVRLPAESWRRGPGGRFTKLQLLLLRGTVSRNRACVRSHNLAATDRLVGVALTGRWTKAAFLDTLERVPAGWTELMVHPGRSDGLAGEATRLVQSRGEELAILVDSEVKDRCGHHGINLVSYRELAEHRP